MSIDVIRRVLDRCRTPVPVLLFSLATLAPGGVVQAQTASEAPKLEKVKIIEFLTDPVTCLSGLIEPEMKLNRVPKATLMPGNQPVLAKVESRGYYKVEYTSESAKNNCFVRAGAVRIDKADAKPVATCAPVVVAQARGGGTRGASEGCR